MIAPGPVPGAFAALRRTTPEPTPPDPLRARRHTVHAPGVTPGRFSVPRRVPFVPTLIVGVPAFGTAGAGTFVLALASGTRITYGWVTEIITTYGGSEQRISWQAAPSIKIEGTALVLDADDRAMRATLMRAVAQGAPFLLALMSEARTVVHDAVGNLLGMGTTASIDWALAGQRVLMVGIDGTSQAAVIQDVSASQLAVDVLPGSRGAAGSLIVPLLAVIMESQQGFHRYPVSAETWDIRARAVQYGWCGQDRCGRGAQVLTFDAGSVSVDALTDESLIIWDRVNGVEGTASETLASKADIVDLGGAVFAVGGNSVPEWMRPIKLHTTSRTDIQWLRGVAHHLRGRQGMFLLSTNRNDLPYVSAPGIAQVTVRADYVSWFASLAHRRIAITTTGGIVQYLSVLSVVDQGDGTNTLTLSDGIFGVPSKISFLEQVRLESDDVPEVWSGPDMTCDLVAHVVQDTTTTTQEDLVTSAFAGHGLDGNIIFPVDVFVMDRDYHWETGQLQAGSRLLTMGFVPRFRTVLAGPAVGTATIERNGAHATGAIPGDGYTPRGDDPILCGTIGGGSGTGATGTTGLGASPPGIADNLWPTRNHPGRGGNGGSGAAGFGGSGGAATIVPDANGSVDVIVAHAMRMNGGDITGGAGGGSGSGSGTQPGGGGGAGAGNLALAAGVFLYPEHIIVQAVGGNGGAGAGTGCGGGGGGGGGDVSICGGRLPLPSNIQAAGGAGGLSGGGVGQLGTAGDSGSVFLFIG